MMKKVIVPAKSLGHSKLKSKNASVSPKLNPYKGSNFV